MNSTRPIAASTIFHAAMPAIDAPAKTRASAIATTAPLTILYMTAYGAPGRGIEDSEARTVSTWQNEYSAPSRARRTRSLQADPSMTILG